MKKTILVCLSLVQSLFAATEIELLQQQVLAKLPTLDGWCSREKALEFIDLILVEKPQVWVEIGVFGGSSVYPAASAFKYLGSGKIIAIDPWDTFECIRYYDPIKENVDLQWWGKLNMNVIHASFLKLLKTQGLEPYCEVIRAPAVKAISRIDSIDVLYIDGNHSEIASNQDVELYLPKVRKGGFIWMNDSTWEQRQQATEMLANECEEVKRIDNGNCVLFRKR